MPSNRFLSTCYLTNSSFWLVPFLNIGYSHISKILNSPSYTRWTIQLGHTHLTHNNVFQFNLFRHTLYIIRHFMNRWSNYRQKIWSQSNILHIVDFCHLDELHVVVVTTYVDTLPAIRKLHSVTTYFRMLPAIRQFHTDPLHRSWFDSQLLILLRLSYSIWLIFTNSIQLSLHNCFDSSHSWVTYQWVPYIPDCPTNNSTVK